MKCAVGLLEWFEVKVAIQNYRRGIIFLKTAIVDAVDLHFVGVTFRSCLFV